LESKISTVKSSEARLGEQGEAKGSSRCANLPRKLENLSLLNLKEFVALFEYDYNALPHNVHL
jgi:hypothetical protein